MRTLVNYLAKAALIASFVILPGMALADGDVDHAPGEEHAEEETSAGFNPVIGLTGVVLTVGIGFGVWIFMQKRGEVKGPSQIADTQAKS